MTKTLREKKSVNGSLFSTYLSNMNIPLSSHSKSQEKNVKLNFDNGPSMLSKDVPFPENMKAEFLMRYISAEHKWSEDQTKSDISILIKNRLYTVKDLRILSRESWKQIDLLPIVKDLLREAINRGKLSAEEEYLKKMERIEKKKERRLSREVVAAAAAAAASINITTNINNNNNSNMASAKKVSMDSLPSLPSLPSLSPITSLSSKNETSDKLEVERHPIRSSSLPQVQQSSQSPIAKPKNFHNIKQTSPYIVISNNSSSNNNNKDNNNKDNNNKDNNNKDNENKVLIDTDSKVTTKTVTKTTTKTTTTVTDPSTKLENVKRFMPKPNKVLVGEDRMKIRTDDGKVYEIDRYCPHAGSDLFSRGAVVGSKFICSKHYWAFSLQEGGKCVSGGKGSINACAINNW